MMMASLAAVATAVPAPSRVWTANVVTTGSIRVRLDYAYTPDRGWIRPGPRIRIYRSGELAADDRVTADQIPLVHPVSPAIVDLDHDGEPEVLITAAQAGANCCSVSFLYWYDARVHRYRKTTVLWGEYRDRPDLVDLDRDGRTEFVTVNERFSSHFGFVAIDAIAPCQIFRFSHGRIEGITRRYPG